MQIERCRQSKAQFCCRVFSRLGFGYSLTPCWLRLSVTASSEGFWSVPPGDSFSKKRLAKYHEAVFEFHRYQEFGKFSGGSFEELFSNEPCLEGTLFLSLKGLLLHEGAILTVERLAHSNIAKFRASAGVNLAHFNGTHLLQRLPFT